MHKSCMEKWLNLRNKDTCELCHFKFNTKRKFRPLHKVGIVFILVSFVDRSVETSQTMEYLLRFVVMLFTSTFSKSNGLCTSKLETFLHLRKLSSLALSRFTLLEKQQ